MFSLANQSRNEQVRGPLAAVRAPILFVFLTLCLCACTAVFVAPYDETTDRLLTNLSVSTETIIAKADADQLSEKERQEFFDSALGTVRTLKARASLFQKNEDEVAALGDLEQRYENLRKRTTPPRSSLATAVRLTLLDLQQIQVAKKRSSVFTTSLKKSNSKP